MSRFTNPNRHRAMADTDAESEAPSLAEERQDSFEDKKLAAPSFDDDDDNEQGMQFLPSTYLADKGTNGELVSPLRNPPSGKKPPPPSSAAEADAAAPAGTVFPFSVPREEHFSARTWFLVDLKVATAGGLATDSLPSQGATPLVARCMRNYNWDEYHSRRVLASYRHFLILKKERQDWAGKELSPCPHVELMWKEHICDMINYWHDCQILCGHVLSYDPEDGQDPDEHARRVKMTRQAMLQKFGTVYDQELWGMVKNTGSRAKDVMKHSVARAKSPGPSARTTSVRSTTSLGSTSSTSARRASTPARGRAVGSKKL
mmetsp:Transcript_24183/g.67050  ORF Transcript_24183/g.67050 Transcript_24183/m.67050 type:complete len:317 (-) Transcript_24183:252-1202(-)